MLLLLLIAIALLILGITYGLIFTHQYALDNYGYTPFSSGMMVLSVTFALFLFGGIYFSGVPASELLLTPKILTLDWYEYSNSIVATLIGVGGVAYCCYRTFTRTNFWIAAIFLVTTLLMAILVLAVVILIMSRGKKRK